MKIMLCFGRIVKHTYYILTSIQEIKGGYNRIQTVLVETIRSGNSNYNPIGKGTIADA